MQLEHLPQKSGKLSVMIGERQLIAFASMSASVYLPEPVGPASATAWGKRSRASISRRRWTMSELPWKSVNKAISFQLSALSQGTWQLANGIRPIGFAESAEYKESIRS
jgi:hypothetical protein